MRGVSEIRGMSLAAAVALGIGTAAVEPVQDDARRTGSLKEVDYLIGEWTVRSFSRDSSGEFVEAEFESWYRARYLRDGNSILAEFFEENHEGFYGVHLISRVSGTELVHYYLNASADRRIEFRGKFENGEYHLSRPGGYGGGDFLYKETDSEIMTDSFVKRIYRSDDNGGTWKEGDFYFRFERLGDPGVNQ